MSREMMFNRNQDISTFLDIWLTHALLAEANQKVFDNYYASYKARFDKYIRYHYAQQTVEALEIAEKLETPKLLEVGCGCGTESLYFELNGINVTAVDNQDALLGVARERKEIIEKQLGRELPCEFINRSVLDFVVSRLLIKAEIIFGEMSAC